jgi:hypothetical protein
VNVRDWLAHREPSPPRELRERVEALATAVPQEPGDPMGSLLTAAEAALTRLGAQAPDNRSMALDLLAIDALVTYALEWAAEDPERIPEVSARAMTILSRVPLAAR